MHGLNSKHQGTKRPVGFCVDAEWCNTIDMGPKDSSDDPRLKDSLENSGFASAQPRPSKNPETHRLRLYIPICVINDTRKVKWMILFGASNTPGAPLPSCLGGTHTDTVSWQIWENPPLKR